MIFLDTVKLKIAKQFTYRLVGVVSLLLGSTNLFAMEGRFEVIGGGSIKDSQTGLVWAQADNGSDINWKDAAQWCADHNARLPTIKELQGIYDETGALSTSCGEYTCKVSPLFKLTAVFFWSSEPTGSTKSEAWGVDLESNRSIPVAGFGSALDNRALCIRRS